VSRKAPPGQANLVKEVYKDIHETAEDRKSCGAETEEKDQVEEMRIDYAMTQMVKY
jgi:hypothetical protein